MAYPSEGLEGIFRNPYSQVKRKGYISNEKVEAVE
jgi:hypothetical protein